MKAKYLFVVAMIFLAACVQQEYKITEQSKEGPKVLTQKEFLGIPNETKTEEKMAKKQKQAVAVEETKSISPLCQDQINKLKRNVESLKLGLDKLKQDLDEKEKLLLDLKANNSNEAIINEAQKEYDAAESAYNSEKGEVLDKEKELREKERECGVEETNSSTSILEGVYSGNCEEDVKEARKKVRERDADYQEEVRNVEELEQQLDKAKEANDKNQIDSLRNKLDSAKDKRDEEEKQLKTAEDELEALLKVCPNTVN